MEKIYVLKCDHSNYYVGKTSNVNRRFAEHLDGSGSAWTSLHEPKEIVEVTNKSSDYDELKKTLEYMNKYGVDRVRGALWSNVELTEDQRTTIGKMINQDACFRCGRKDHFARDCQQPNSSQPKPPPVPSLKRGQAVRPPRESDLEAHAQKRRREMPRMQCHRCGRDSHDAAACYATFDRDGRLLECARCGRESHSVADCYAHSDINGRRLN